MTQKSIKKYLDRSGYRWFILGNDYQKDSIFINGLYEREKKPVFEHSSYHVLSYLKFRSHLFAVAGYFGQSVLVLREGEVFLFTPEIDSFREFEKFFITSGAVRIQNVSQQWLESFNREATVVLKKSLRVKPRSREEAVYNIQLLSELKGGAFAKMRYVRNRLLFSGCLTFQKVTAVNFKDACWVLDRWYAVQGHKYKKDKQKKERFVLEKFLGFAAREDDFIFEIGYIEKRPLSIWAMHRVPGKKRWGVNYLLKGINRESEGGVHGVSDATYCHCFLKAAEAGIKYLNDGELGEEKGTREHKMRFRPVEFLKSFDLLANQ